MKGNGENVGEDKRKEERNDGGKACTLTESTPVLTGDYSSTYVSVLERISLKRCSFMNLKVMTVTVKMISLILPLWFY